MKITKLGHCCLVIDASTELSAGPVHRLPEDVLGPLGVRFVAMKEGSEEEF